MRTDGFCGDAMPHAGWNAWSWLTCGCLTLAVFLAILLSVGCGTLQADYVHADRLTHDSIAPVYSAYVTGDDKLSKAQKERKHRLLRSWEARLVEGETHGSE